MNRSLTAPPAVDYPCSDGQPLAESDFQLEPIVYAITTLRMHFHPRGRAYVAGDMFLYYEEALVRIHEERAAHREAQAHLAREVEARRAAEARLAELEARRGQSP